MKESETKDILPDVQTQTLKTNAMHSELSNTSEGRTTKIELITDDVSLCIPTVNSTETVIGIDTHTIFISVSDLTPEKEDKIDITEQ